MKVLFIGGDGHTIERTQLAVRLRWPDASVIVSHDVGKGIALLDSEYPDVCFVQHAGNEGHLSLPDIIREIHASSDVPVIILEREGFAGEMDEIQSLEVGADDYIKAGTGVIELVARLTALMRRVWRSESASSDQSVACGSLVLNPATYEVFLNGKRLVLTSTEFRLLHLLVKNHGAIVTHRMIELAVWGDQVERAGVSKKYIQRLRRKLGGDAGNRPWVVTIHGVGYRLIGDTDEPEGASHPINGSKPEPIALGTQRRPLVRAG